MGDLVSNYRFVVKPVIKETGRSLDLARPMKIHPLTYQELPLNPEYTNYAVSYTHLTLPTTLVV